MVDVDAVDTASLVFWSASLGLTLSFLIMGFLSVRGKGDPARTGAKWYKVASVLILLYENLFLLSLLSLLSLLLFE